ncbi:MAG: hypothetical protein K8I27_08535 [Planctomycetes bacterium]|nr:hypothetical protein [Planctomycetota bacterium]
MVSRLLHFRLTFATIAMLALISGALLETVWLVAPGAAAAAASDIIGLLQSRVRFALPVERAFRGASESLPAIGLAAFEPWAIGVAIAVVIHALIANGLHTISVARGQPLKRNTGETLRQLLTAAAGLSLLWIPVSATTSLDIVGVVGTSPPGWAVIASVVVALAGMRALLDQYLGIREA